MLHAAALILSVLCLVCASVLSHLVGPSFILLHVPLVAATFSTLKRPFVEAATLTLLLAFLDDALSSGPPGTQQMSATITFFLIALVAKRLNGHLLVVGPSLVLLGCMIQDLLLSALLMLRYPRLPILSLMAQSMLWSALASALAFVPYALIMGWIERVWLQRANKHSLWA